MTAIQICVLSIFYPAQVVKLLDWMLDIATVLYVENDICNDFFLLHGVTGGMFGKMREMSRETCPNQANTPRTHDTTPAHEHSSRTVQMNTKQIQEKRSLCSQESH